MHERRAARASSELERHRARRPARPGRGAGRRSSTPTSCCSPTPTSSAASIERIRAEQVNAEWAVQKTAEELRRALRRRSTTPYLRERSEDLHRRQPPPAAQPAGDRPPRALGDRGRRRHRRRRPDALRRRAPRRASSVVGFAHREPAAGPRTPRSSPARSTCPRWPGSTASLELRHRRRPGDRRRRARQA